MNIQVTLDFARPHEKYVHVRYDVNLPASLTGSDPVFTMPSWTPGSYLVRDFAQHVEAFQAFDSDGRALPFVKISKNQWQIQRQDAAKIRLEYKVYANDLSVRAVYADHEFAFANAPAVFFYLEGFLNEPVTLKIKLPRGWQLATAKKDDKGKFTFANFDEFFDTPFLAAAEMDVRKFKVRDTGYRLATIGPHRADLERVVKDLQKVIAKQNAVFGSNPCADYLFQLLFIKGSYGGLEHSFSSSNIFDGLSLSDPKRYPILVALLAHEHFHLWNVKRIRPRALGPFDYTRENYTRELWIAEGLTSYYDDHTVYRAGIYDQAGYFEVLSDNIAKLEAGKGAKLNSLSDASFDAWIRFYRPNENSQNVSVSYYLKGGLVMMLLDFEIIKKSQGRHNLDDLMRLIWLDYKKRPELGLTREEFFKRAEELTGGSLAKFIADHIDGTAVIDWAKEFDPFGIELKEDAKKDGDYYLGVTGKESGGKLLIDKIAEDSPAFASILQAGDEVLAANGLRIETIKQLKDALHERELEVLFARRGKVSRAKVTLTKPPSRQKKLALKSKLTPNEKKYLAIFLRQ